MLYAVTNLPAAAVGAVGPVRQPQRNSTEIVFRCGTAEHMPEPFRSHMDGTLTFAVVHPSVVIEGRVAQGAGLPPHGPLLQFHGDANAR